MLGSWLQPPRSEGSKVTHRLPVLRLQVALLCLMQDCLTNKALYFAFN